jgi:hypothetical protein
MKRFLFCIFLMVIGAGLFTQEAEETQKVNPPSDKIYKIGDIGPANGIVFYDKGVFSNGWRYLEAAPIETEFESLWCVYSQAVQGTSPVIGSGKRNTDLIVKQGGKSAAMLCASMNFDGFTDWFLPSKDELDLMYKNLKRKKLGNFSNYRYWSSTESSTDMAYCQTFSNSTVHRDNKDETHTVRAVRAF